MRLPFNGSYKTTQSFNDGCCRASYARFGMTGHNGIDYGLPCGTPIVSPINGSVYYFWDPQGYGNAVYIRGEGVEVVLAHLSQVDVRSGNVSAGQYIGKSGTTGNSSGCHLHFGVRTYPSYNVRNGFFGYVDPNQYLNQGGNKKVASDNLIKGYYKVVLGRDASDTDLKAWRGKDPETVFNGIAASQERVSFVKDRIKWLYEGVLRRKASDTEVNGWYRVAQRNLFADILNSGESKAINEKLKAYQEVKNQVDSLSKRPTKEEFDKIKAELDKANKTIESLKAEGDTGVVPKEETDGNDKMVVDFITRLIDKIKNVFNK